jgi:hypothetical protein
MLANKLSKNQLVIHKLLSLLLQIIIRKLLLQDNFKPDTKIKKKFFSLIDPEKSRST